MRGRIRVILPLVICVLGVVNCSSETEPAPVTDPAGKPYDLGLSPDGTKSIYSAVTSDGGRQLFLADADGGQPVQITFVGVHNHSPAWSPCGCHILFVSDRDGDDEIFLMDADGGHQRQLTFNEHWDGSPAWSPDGRQILFSSKRDGNVELYAITDGAGTMRLEHSLTEN